MSRETFILDLERAADNIGDVPRHELAILLRRAALRLRNVGQAPVDLERQYQQLIDDLNGEAEGPK